MMFCDRAAPDMSTDGIYADRIFVDGFEWSANQGEGVGVDSQMTASPGVEISLLRQSVTDVYKHSTRDYTNLDTVSTLSPLTDVSSDSSSTTTHTQSTRIITSVIEDITTSLTQTDKISVHDLNFAATLKSDESSTTADYMTKSFTYAKDTTTLNSDESSTSIHYMTKSSSDLIETMTLSIQLNELHVSQPTKTPTSKNPSTTDNTKPYNIILPGWCLFCKNILYI